MADSYSLSYRRLVGLIGSTRVRDQKLSQIQSISTLPIMSANTQQTSDLLLNMKDLVNTQYKGIYSELDKYETRIIEEMKQKNNLISDYQYEIESLKSEKESLAEENIRLKQQLEEHISQVLCTLEKIRKAPRKRKAQAFAYGPSALNIAVLPDEVNLAPKKRYRKTDEYPRIGKRYIIQWNMTDGGTQLFDGVVTKFRGKIAIKYDDDQDQNCVYVHHKDTIYMYDERHSVIPGYIPQENEQVEYIHPTDASVARTSVSPEGSPLYWHNRIHPKVGHRVKVLWKHNGSDVDIWRVGTVHTTRGHYCFKYDDELVERLHHKKSLVRYELVRTTI